MKHKLVPLRYLCAVHDSYDAHPSYVVCGGCVFVPLSWPWISAHKHSDGWEGGFPSYNSVSSLPAEGEKQVIVLSKVLADEVNIGYHLKKWLILCRVNGEVPANMRELVRLISKAGSKKHLEFRLHPINEEDFNEQAICLDMEECKQAEDRILKQHMIASWCSDDVIPAEIDVTSAKTMVSTLKCTSDKPKTAA
uniref:Protease Do-like PDZ domain-containing protein n=1 Tax=Pseudictyota dubia TaxID=2749911 RepID=A0A7R9VDH9_9STRA